MDVLDCSLVERRGRRLRRGLRQQWLAVSGDCPVTLGIEMHGLRNVSVAAHAQHLVEATTQPVALVKV